MLSSPTGSPPSSLKVGSEKLPLGAWESSVLTRVVDGNGGQPEWAPLLLESVALRAKFRAELDELAHGGDSAATTMIHRHFTVDAAIGLALLRDTQQAVDEMILGGKLDLAKKLSAFRAKLSGTVKQIRARLNAESFAEAEKLSAEMRTADRAAPRSAEPDPAATGDDAVPEPGLALPEVDRSRFAKTDEQADARRMEILRPHIAQLELLKSSAGSNPVPFENNAGAASLGLDDWEKTVLDRVLSGTAGEAQRWPALMLQGVALQDSYCCSVEHLDGAEALDADDRGRIESRLVVDAAMGLALGEELQRVVNDLVADNRLEEAKRLSSFRNRLNRCVSAARERVGPEAFDVACDLSAEMVVRRDGDSVSAPVLQRLFDESQEFDGRAAAVPLAKAEAVPDRSRPLALVLGLLLVVWAVFILPRLTEEKLPELLAQDVPQSPALLEVVSAPPSMFVTVDQHMWKELPRADRRLFVDQLGQTASKASYTGVQVRSDEGQTVAQWLKETGVTVFDLSESP